MSLRFFHIVFITLVTLLALGIATLEYANFRATGASDHLLVTRICVVIGIGFIAYGIWFFRKTKRLIL